ncbi:PREDICTED: cyclin-F [Thamnophis sirtalis]|uniref:Cyclin-F n=1 Tax=Thamnophis sirtalis TaxID=35019 RepID=A0A6I9Y9J0_9SAUR|nr:PREDICTED: cyclin-F [Thamnophis sirtalis]
MSPATSWSLAKISRQDLVLQSVGQVCWIASSIRDPVDPSDYLYLQQVTHCRCSRCFPVPSKRRLKKRPRVLTLLSLPEDILFHVLKGLPIEDILSLRAVHSHLKYLIDNHTCIWACASFQEEWPSPRNLKIFERAAEKGNFEAAVKLGIAYLYNEGRKCLHPTLETVVLACQVYFNSNQNKNNNQRSDSSYILAAVRALSNRNTPNLLPEHNDEGKRKEALEMFEDSSKQGCLHSSYLLWENNQKAAMSDPGRYLQSLRQLKDYAAKGSWEAQITLAKACGNGNQLGPESKTSVETISQFFQASVPLSKQSIFTVQKGMNETMRYILVDWLVEVATMKDFSSLCLHMTIGCVDRYLKLRSVPRARLQLLGIACMVICTRFVSKEILTIREAVWLTDNTYKYEDLVRMMGEIISALEGRIKIPTIVDYKEVLLNITSLERRTASLYSFICELSLLNTGLCGYSPARLSAAALLLAKVLHRQARPWTSQLTEYTGFSLEELVPCVLSLHKKCFHEDAPKDYRQVSLTAVKQRFEDKRYEEIGKEEDLGKPCCCQESSDDESLPQEGCQYVFKDYDHPNEERAFIIIQASPGEASSGYASVNSTSPPSATDGNFSPFLKASSGQPLRLAKDQILPLPLHSESCLPPTNGRSSRRQAKRKNVTPYGEEEKNRLGFLSL